MQGHLNKLTKKPYSCRYGCCPGQPGCSSWAPAFEENLTQQTPARLWAVNRGSPGAEAAPGHWVCRRKLLSPGWPGAPGSSFV